MESLSFCCSSASFVFEPEKALPSEINCSCEIGAPISGVVSGKSNLFRADGERLCRAVNMVDVVTSRTIFNLRCENQSIDSSYDFYFRCR